MELTQTDIMVVKLVKWTIAVQLILLITFLFVRAGG